jgi:hypothetical protein
LVLAAGWAEDAGDLGDGFAAGFDAAHGGAEILVPGLGHDELERDFGVATGKAGSDHVEWCWPGFCGGGIRQVW